MSHAWQRQTHRRGGGQRVAILGSPLRELTGFYLSVDCMTAGCGSERTYAVAELASFYGQDQTVGSVLRRMRCGTGCGGRAMAAWLATGPILNRCVRPRHGGDRRTILRPMLVVIV